MRPVTVRPPLRRLILVQGRARARARAMRARMVVVVVGGVGKIVAATAEILGDPYSKKKPLPSIGNFPRLDDSPKLSSY
jgi:hypothetical protein